MQTNAQTFSGCDEALLEAAARLKQPYQGDQGKLLLGSVASALPSPSVETQAHTLKNEGGEISRELNTAML